MRDAVLTLIKETITADEVGNQIATETSQEVFCSVYPISQNESFEAKTIDINPVRKFLVFFGDYSGETLCEFEGQRLAIYRVYDREDDTVELYAERKLGRNGGTNGN